MRPTELLYGEREASKIRTRTVKSAKTQKDTLIIEAVEILYLLYETPMNQSRKMIPKSLHPSVPAIVGVTLIQASEGPLDAFCLAFVGVACRTGIKPRHFITSSFCNNDKAGQFFCNRYGFNCEKAEIILTENYDEISGTITTGGTEILRTSINNCIPLVGGSALIKYSPPLNAVQLDEPAMIQFEAAYDFKRVVRGECRTSCFSAESLTENMLAPSRGIAGSHAVVDLTFLPVRFRLDMQIPAEEGGARKI